MKTKILLKSVCVLLITASSFSQNTSFSSLLIPQELKEDANAVIRLNEKIIKVTSVNELVVKEKKIITVLNKLGNNYVDMYVRYDNDTKVTGLSAVIYDGLGKKIKKYSKNKFKDVSAVSGGTLYSDDRLKYLEYTPVSYPYTVVFESEYKTSSTGFIPSWFPIEGYYVSVQKSVYRFINQTNITYKKKAVNLTNYPINKVVALNSITYTLNNQKVIDYERYTLPARKFLPKLNISLNEFWLKGVYGTATNWKDFGKWMYNSLLEGRDILDESTKTKIKDLVKNTNDPIEKAKIVYQFMQNKTRYISVQVGIGGWEPIAANKVDVVGYGDCKGLTNYTKALLDVVGVKSFYTVVYADQKRDIDKDFTSMQGNHAILNIPNGNEDIWLECTNQTIPFGFLGDFTDDRDVLVITPEGGIIKRTPKYINDYNLQTVNANIELIENGNVNATVIRKSYGTQYNFQYRNEDKSKEELEKHYKSNVWSYNNNLEIEEVKLTNNKEKVEFIEEVTLKISSFASVKDSTFLFKVNMFNKFSGVPKRYRKRKRPFVIERGFTDKDEFLFKLPKGFKLTYLQPKIAIKNKFGAYTVTLEKKDSNTLKYSRTLSLKDGVYPKTAYKSYRSFRKKIAKYDNLRIELTKK